MYNGDEALRGDDEAVQQEAARIIQRQWRVYQQHREDLLEAQQNALQQGDAAVGTAANATASAAGGGEQTSGEGGYAGGRVTRIHVPNNNSSSSGGADVLPSSLSLLPRAEDAAAMTTATTSMTAAEALLNEYSRLYVEWYNTRERNAALQHVLARHLMEQRHRKGEDVQPPPPTPTTQSPTTAGAVSGAAADNEGGGGEGGDAAANSGNNNSAAAAASAAAASAAAAAAAANAEQRYWGAVTQLHDAQQQLKAKQCALEQAIEQRRAALQHTIDAAATQEQRFRAYIADMATRATFVRSNHTTMPPEQLSAFLDEDDALRCRIRDARVRHLQLQHHTSKLQRLARERDKRGDGMYLIDYEQLKIEKGSLQEKLEERNEDVVKLRGKVTTTIHVLTHVKEKLEHVRSENVQLREQVAATEGELASVRDALAQTKRRRDGFVRANLRMREKMPLVGSEELLRDYEQRKAVIHDTRLRVVALTERHRQLMHCLRAQQPIIETLKHAISQYPT